MISSALANHAILMLEPPKRVSVSCEALLADPLMQGSMSHSPTSSPITARAMTFGGRSINAYGNGNGNGGLEPKTPMHLMPFGSPEGGDYFRMGLGMSMSMTQQRKQTSRWKEDWEELELLVRILGIGYRNSLTI